MRRVAPQGTFSCPDGQFTLPHPTVKFVDRYNPQELSVVTRKRVARHGYPTGDLLLPFGQFTSCRACGDEAAGVAVRNLALRRGREIGAQCAPLSLSKKQHFDSCTSCGSTHKIEFAEQIHKFREHVSRNLYKGRKNVPARRVFSSKFDRKRGFDREAARKTLVFRQPHGRTMCAPTEGKILCCSYFRSGRRSPVCVRLTSKGSGIQKGGNLGVHPFAHRRGYGAFCGLQQMQQFSFLLHYAIIKNKGMRNHADRNSTVRAA